MSKSYRVNGMLFQFIPPEGGCHQYFVHALIEKEAIEKFIIWQEENLNTGSRWPLDIIKNEDNWIESDVIFVE